MPSYNEKIFLGLNTIGNPSVMAFKNSKNKIFLDEKLTWMVDVDFYKKLYDRHGPPKILSENTVAIRLWSKQMPHLIPFSIKEKEKRMMVERYVKAS